MSSERGVGPVVGVILIIAIVLTVAATVAAFGAAMLQDTQSDIEQSQTESAFSQLAVDASELREDGDQVSFDLGHRDGQVQTVDGTGHLEVRLERGSGEDVIYNTDLRSLVYEHDGDKVAYQGGGVFRKKGSGSSLVSSPEFFYRDNSLVFPVTILEGDLDRSGSLQGSLSLSERERIFPTTNASRSNPLEQGTIYITLESEYCHGWEEYFSTQTRGSVVENCSDTGDTSDGEIKVEMSVPFELGGGTFTEPVKAGSVAGENKANFDYTEGEIETPSADSLIEMKKNECGTINEDLPTTIDSSKDLYCVEDLDGTHTIETNGSDIEVYVNGTFQPTGDVVVDGGSHDVSFFVQDGFDMTDIGPNDAVGDEDEPARTRIFVSSDGYVFSDGDNIKGNVYALVYAPESDAHLQSTGNTEFKGGLIVDSLNVQSNMKSDDVQLSANAPSVEISYESAGPDFYYLHLLEKRMTIQG
ncbi:Protein of unknown function [Natronoarchaeum philippinense]|uniref:DUF7305 domain-containing protein n=1 Tax=Natronoarchaeum philippinense TaxID=558529 RepID=A0A285N5G5_NATPI|nr:type IV pilin [Natronoarchaeum philippinense]SNZ04173.1 Protein of unknown function [Natronoarchaeum philippinense]